MSAFWNSWELWEKMCFVGNSPVYRVMLMIGLGLRHCTSLTCRITRSDHRFLSWALAVSNWSAIPGNYGNMPEVTRTRPFQGAKCCRWPAADGSAPTIFRSECGRWRKASRLKVSGTLQALLRPTVCPPVQSRRLQQVRFQLRRHRPLRVCITSRDALPACVTVTRKRTRLEGLTTLS